MSQVFYLFACLIGFIALDLALLIAIGPRLLYFFLTGQKLVGVLDTIISIIETGFLFFMWAAIIKAHFNLYRFYNQNAKMDFKLNLKRDQSTNGVLWMLSQIYSSMFWVLELPSYLYFKISMFFKSR